MKKLGRTRSVVHWNVDFVPRRFDNPVVNRIYETLDRYCWTKSDAHVELTTAALTARSRLYKISVTKKDRIVPMGSWVQEEGFVPKEQFDLARLVFVGHLVERMGVNHLIGAMVSIRLAIPNAHLTIVGDGPERSRLEELAIQLGLRDGVSFLGFLASDADVEMSIRTSTLAVAPYLTNRDNFSQFADPGKLKMFVGAGIPILTTDVAPFASELYREGAALEIRPSSESIATKVIEVLSNRAMWELMCNNSSRLGRQYSWENIFCSIEDLVDLDHNSNT
jgi:glycosyltransferase involved in cell wall biosynthesis